jgi:shikimate kinase
LPPKVFIISGAAASGKSSYAKTLRKRENFTILDLDDRLNELIEKDPGHVKKIGMEAFLKEIREFRYNDLRERGLAMVDQGKSVALVAPFTQHIRNIDQWNWLMRAICCARDYTRAALGLCRTGRTDEEAGGPWGKARY